MEGSAPDRTFKTVPRRQFTLLSYRGGGEPLIEVAPGDQIPVEGPRPGDFIVTHGGALSSRLIRLGQRLLFRGADRPYAHWNHVGLLVPENDHLVIVEALGRGVVVRDLSVYQNQDFKLVHIERSGDDSPILEGDRKQAVDFAKWAAGRQDINGQPVTGAKGAAYGFLTIVSISLMLVGWAVFLALGVAAAFLYAAGKHQPGLVTLLAAFVVLILRGVAFSSPGQMICSGLVARSLERVGFIFGWKPVTHIMPADLAKYFDVRRDE